MLAADAWVSAGDGKNVIESALDGTVYDLESGKVCPLLAAPNHLSLLEHTQTARHTLISQGYSNVAFHTSSIYLHQQSFIVSADHVLSL